MKYFIVKNMVLVLTLSLVACASIFLRNHNQYQLTQEILKTLHVSYLMEKVDMC